MRAGELARDGGVRLVGRAVQLGGKSPRSSRLGGVAVRTACSLARIVRRPAARRGVGAPRGQEKLRGHSTRSREEAAAKAKTCADLRRGGPADGEFVARARSARLCWGARLRGQRLRRTSGCRRSYTPRRRGRGR